MKDRYGREIHAMRISVTDRCNMRCQYCMSSMTPEFSPRENLLTLEEIDQVITAATYLGFDSFRFTGGEPLVRRGIVDLITRVGRLKSIRRLSLSTNGTFLAANLDALAAARVTRLNISLDSLQPERYARITRGADLAPVRDAIEKAVAHGAFNVKLNTVLVRGFNDDEIANIAALTIDQPVSVRFIEYMPFGEWKDCPDASKMMSVAEMITRLRERYDVAESAGPGGEGPARYMQIKGARGYVGLISPVYEPFCARCNRLRLTADGRIKSCLLDDEQSNLRDWMRGPDYSFDKLILRIAAAILAKPEKHSYSRNFNMSTVGG